MWFAKLDSQINVYILELSTRSGHAAVHLVQRQWYEHEYLRKDLVRVSVTKESFYTASTPPRVSRYSFLSWSGIAIKALSIANIIQFVQTHTSSRYCIVNPTPTLDKECLRKSFQARWRRRRNEFLTCAPHLSLYRTGAQCQFLSTGREKEQTKRAEEVEFIANAHTTQSEYNSSEGVEKS